MFASWQNIFTHLPKKNIIGIWWCTCNNSGPCQKVFRTILHKPVNTERRHDSPAHNLYTFLNEHLWCRNGLPIQQLWRNASISVLLCLWLPLVPHYLLLPSIPQVPWWEAILKKNQCCRNQEAKAYYVSADNKSIFLAFTCACDLHTYFISWRLQTVLCQYWMLVAL